MMNHLRDIALYILAVIIGYGLIIPTYHLAVALGIFAMTDALYESGTFWSSYLLGTSYAWMAGGFLGLSFFIYRGPSRRLLLLIPLILPAAYGFSVLVKLGV